jgi:hypothetical protein
MKTKIKTLTVKQYKKLMKTDLIYLNNKLVTVKEIIGKLVVIDGTIYKII